MYILFHSDDNGGIPRIVGMSEMLNTIYDIVNEDIMDNIGSDPNDLGAYFEENSTPDYLTDYYYVELAVDTRLDSSIMSGLASDMEYDLRSNHCGIRQQISLKNVNADFVVERLKEFKKLERIAELKRELELLEERKE